VVFPSSRALDTEIRKRIVNTNIERFRLLNYLMTQLLTLVDGPRLAHVGLRRNLSDTYRDCESFSHIFYFFILVVFGFFVFSALHGAFF